MYEVIKHYLKKLIPKGWLVSNRQVVEQEFEIIFDKIKAARTLAQLLEVRKDVEAYRGMVQSLDSPKWAIKKLNLLVANWQRQYRLWKRG